MCGRMTLHEVVRRPGPGKLHATLLQFLRRRRVLVLIALYRAVVDEVCDVEQHLAALHAFAGDLLGQGQKHTVHLDRERTRLALALTLPGGRLSKAGQVLLADPHIPGGVAGAGIVH